MALSPLILAIDAGSRSMRCSLFAEDGALVSSSVRRLASATPAPDWHEQDAGAIWDALLEALAELAASYDLARVVAVGLDQPAQHLLAVGSCQRRSAGAGDLLE